MCSFLNFCKLTMFKCDIWVKDWHILWLIFCYSYNIYKKWLTEANDGYSCSSFGLDLKVWCKYNQHFYVKNKLNKKSMTTIWTRWLCYKIKIPMIVGDKTKDMQITSFNRHAESMTNIKHALRNSTQEVWRTKIPKKN